MRRGRALSVPSLQHGCRGVSQAAPERCYLQGFCPHPVSKDLFQLEYSRYSGLPEFSWMSGDEMETQDSILLPPGGSFWVWEWARGTSWTVSPRPRVMCCFVFHRTHFFLQL